jgi:L-threonylcarbamoyladenylate synthase
VRISLEEAVVRLSRAELVAFPTETVYGLGADAADPIALRRVFATKGRPVDHPLIVHVNSLEAAERLGVFDARARVLARRFWPGPLTLVLPRRSGVPDEVTGGLDTVGLRIPAHPLALGLLAAFPSGLAAPSANRFGRTSPTTATHVEEELGLGFPILDGGPCAVGVESTIVELPADGAAPALLRPGGLPTEVIVTLIGPLGRSVTRAPGTLTAHYAPRTSLLLAEDPEARAAELRDRGLRVALLPAGEPAEHARRLFAELRALDQLGVDVLVAGLAVEAGLGVAVNDRLRRAAAGSPLRG